MKTLQSPLYFSLLLLFFSCENSTKKSPLVNEWIAYEFTSSGQAIPDYLVSDFTIKLNEDGTYTGNLHFLELANEGTYTSQSDSILLIGKDTFNIESISKDSLFLTHKSFSVPFEIKLASKQNTP